MAKASSARERKEPLSCSICQDTFQDITLSSCFHTFCRKCLDGHIKSSKGRTNYECPICNTSITLSSELFSSPLRDDLRRPEDVYPGSSPWNEFCDICNGRVPAVNRCLQCNESFCENCTLVHMRMKASRYHGHRVVPLWGQGSGEPFDDKEKYCPRHRNEEIIVVCKQCNVILCLICKLMEHEHHVTRLISEEAADMRNNLTDMLQHQIGLSESLHTKKDMLQTNKSHIVRGLDNELAKIRHHASKVELQLERERTNRERELIRHYESLHKNTTDAYVTVNEDFGEFANVSKKAQNLLDDDNDVTLVTEGPRIYEKLKKLEQARTPLHVGKPSKVFVPGNIESGQMQQMMGYVTDRDNITTVKSRESLLTPAKSEDRQERHFLSRINASKAASFQLPFKDTIGYVYGIAIVGKDKAWIIMLGHSEVTLVDINGCILDQVNVGEPCGGLATDWRGGCFVSCPQSKTVKHIKVFGDTKVETVLKGLDQDPHGMTSTRSGNDSEELIICFTATKELSYDNQKGCVRLYSFNGDEFGLISALQAPVRIDADSREELLCISDHSNGLVTVCDKSGQFIKGIYSGDDDIGSFRPLGVCFDPFGGVLIADWKSGTLHRITSEGNFIQSLIEDIDGPQSVAVDDSQQLWVGCKHGRIHIYQLN